MILVEFHHVDGRPVTFDRETVILMEPHFSGEGTLVRLGAAERAHDMHLSESYDHVRTEVTLSQTDRVLRMLKQQREAEKTPV